MAWNHPNHAKHNRPARGGPSTGSGWGGPPKGAGRGGASQPFGTDSATRTTIPATQASPRDKKGLFMANGDPAKAVTRQRRELAKDERIADLVETLEDLALDTSQPGTIRVMAADKALDRLAGKPLQTNTNLNVDVLDRLSTDQQRAVAEALDALAADAGDNAGGAAETHH